MAKQTFTTGQVLTAAQMTNLQQTAMGGGSTTAKTTSYVLVAADAGTTVAMNAAGSTTITVNTGLFSAGDSVFIQNWGAGTTTVTAGTATVTTHGSLALSQWEGGQLYFTSASAAIFFDISQSTGMTNPMTTTGDTIYSSSGSTPARLGIGSTGNVLTVAGGVPTWAAPAGANPSYSLLSTTTLTGAATFTITGLSGYNTLYMIIKNASAAAASNGMCFRVNSNTSNIYRGYGINISPQASYAASIVTQSVIETTNINIGVMSGAAGSQVSGYVRIEAANGSGIKMFQSAGGSTDESSSGQSARVLGGFIDDTNVISSITFFTDGSSNFDVGTLRIYGSVA